MPRVFAYVGQVAVYGLVALLLGYFSASPTYRSFPADKAQLLLSFSHVGKRKRPCRKLTEAEIAETAPNMRRSEICPRERLPVFVELELSGAVIYRASLVPTGLSKDGASQTYRRFTLKPGRHRIVARLRDSGREKGFDYETEAEIKLGPGENMVVDFRSEFGGFIIGAGSRASEGSDA